MFLFIFMIIMFSFFLNFKKKLYILLLLEILMILGMCFLLLEMGVSNSWFISFFLALMMVLESVMGVSLLICASRISSSLMTKYSMV